MICRVRYRAGNKQSIKFKEHFHFIHSFEMHAKRRNGNEKTTDDPIVIQFSRMYVPRHETEQSVGRNRLYRKHQDGFVFEYKLTNTGDYPVKVVSRTGYLLNVKVRKHDTQKVVYDSYEEVEPKRLSKEVQPHTTVTLKRKVKAGDGEIRLK